MIDDNKDISYEVILQSALKRALRIVVPGRQTESAVSKAIQELKRDAEIPGFRKGRATAVAVQAHNYPEKTSWTCKRSLGFPEGYHEGYMVLPCANEVVTFEEPSYSEFLAQRKPMRMARPVGAMKDRMADLQY